MDACIKELYRIGIVPVVAIEDANDALPLAESLATTIERVVPQRPSAR